MLTFKIIRHFERHFVCVLQMKQRKRKLATIHFVIRDVHTTCTIVIFAILLRSG